MEQLGRSASVRSSRSRACERRGPHIPAAQPSSGIGVPTIRGLRPSTIGSACDQPVASPARWIDQCETTWGCGSQPFFDHTTHRWCAIRERAPQQLAVQKDRGLDLVRSQEQQPRDRLPRRPAQSLGDRPHLSLVPRDLSLDRAHIVDPGLELDDDEGPSRWPVRQEVDPAVSAPGHDLELARHEPARSTQPPGDVGRAPGVHDVVPPTVDDDRGATDELQIDAEAVRDRPGEVDGWIHAPGLDTGDVRP